MSRVFQSRFRIQASCACLGQKHYAFWQEERWFYFCESTTFRFTLSFACLEEVKMHFSCQTADLTFVGKHRCSPSSMVIGILMCHWCWASKTSFKSQNLDPSLDRGHLSYHGWENSRLHHGPPSVGSFSFPAEERRHHFSLISCKLKLSPSVCWHFQADLSTSGVHQKLRFCSYGKWRWYSGMENLLFDVGLMNSSISH